MNLLFSLFELILLLAIFLFLIPLLAIFLFIFLFLESLILFKRALRKFFPTTPTTTTTPKQKSPEILLLELETALIKTLKKRDENCNPDFIPSYSLVYENTGICLCAFIESTDNYSYQSRTGNYGAESQAWENIIIATRAGFKYLGRINLYDRNAKMRGSKIDKITMEGEEIIIYWKRDLEEIRIHTSKLSNTYDYPFEMPPESQMIRRYYEGKVVVVDDDDHEGERVEKYAEKAGMAKYLQVYQLKYSNISSLKGKKGDHKVKAINGKQMFLGSGYNQYGDEVEVTNKDIKFRESVGIVLLDGSMFVDGDYCNTQVLIPTLRKIYPNAIIFANSGKGQNHRSYNRILIKAGCDLGLPYTEYDYKSCMSRIIALCVERRLLNLQEEKLNLGDVLDFGYLFAKR